MPTPDVPDVGEAYLLLLYTSILFHTTAIIIVTKMSSISFRFRLILACFPVCFYVYSGFSVAFFIYLAYSTPVSTFYC